MTQPLPDPRQQQAGGYPPPMSGHPGAYPPGYPPGYPPQQGYQQGYPQQGYPPQPGYPGSPVQPAVRPIPIDKALLATWKTLKSNWKHYVAIGLITYGVSTVVITLGLLGWTTAFLSAIAAMDFGAAIMTLPLVVLVICLVASFVSMAGAAGMAAVADDTGRGLPSKLGDALGRGFRVALKAVIPILAVCAVLALCVAAFGAWLKAVFEALIDDYSDRAVTGMLVGMVLVVVLLLVVMVVTYVLEVRLYLYAPVLLNEPEQTGISALSRSWKLTKGASWRIFGTILLVGVVMGVVMQLAALPMNIVPYLQDYRDFQYASMAEILATMVGAIIPWVVLYMVVSVAVSSVAQAALSIASVIYYHDQLRVKPELAPSDPTPQTPPAAPAPSAPSAAQPATAAPTQPQAPLPPTTPAQLPPPTPDAGAGGFGQTS